jgi:hypothetical protein
LACLDQVRPCESKLRQVGLKSRVVPERNRNGLIFRDAGGLSSRSKRKRLKPTRQAFSYSLSQELKERPVRSLKLHQRL